MLLYYKKCIDLIFHNYDYDIAHIHTTLVLRPRDFFLNNTYNKKPV